MKKIIQSVVCSALLIGLTANAQEKINGNGNVVTQTRTTSEYDAIKISGFYDVDLVAGKEGKITIKGEENILAAIIVEVENNALKIYTKKGTNIRPSTGKKLRLQFHSKKYLNLIFLAQEMLLQNRRLKMINFQQNYPVQEILI
ncbi:GIN domain-containing protein [Flavobacterium sp. P21]|uniref:GIN domain-containing protein n=1 Tax=Flavobacterium sp. P21 TaxID=3423948 RepID=UPI003D66D292